jgi:hypothetical protein
MGARQYFGQSINQAEVGTPFIITREYLLSKLGHYHRQTFRHECHPQNQDRQTPQAEHREHLDCMRLGVFCTSHHFLSHKAIPQTLFDRLEY